MIPIFFVRIGVVIISRQQGTGNGKESHVVWPSSPGVASEWVIGCCLHSASVGIFYPGAVVKASQERSARRPGLPILNQRRNHIRSARADKMHDVAENGGGGEGHLLSWIIY